jgi:hypothetical protein
MKKSLLAILFSLASLLIQAQDYFGGAQWIGAITRQQANIPEGRHYQGSVLKRQRLCGHKPTRYHVAALFYAVVSNPEEPSRVQSYASAD